MSKTKEKGAAKIIVCRIERCLGCRSCETACALAHSESKDLHEAVLEQPLPQRRVRVMAAGTHGLPLQCRHCEDAPCIAICPTGAIYRTSDQGPVLVAAERCIGCKFCMVVCPFGVIDLARDGKAVVKCDLCIERTEAGEEPACVAACPTGAMQFQNLEEWLAERRRAAAEQLVAARDVAEAGDGL